VSSYKNIVETKDRKQHIIVYTLGLPMAVTVHAANNLLPDNAKENF
jgi:hypothetical protein